MFDFTKIENRKYINEFFFFLLKKVNDDIILKHLENLKSDEIFTKSDKNDFVTLSWWTLLCQMTSEGYQAMTRGLHIGCE